MASASLSKFTSSLLKQGQNTARSLATLSSSAEKLQLPELPYSYSALEPVITGELMELHHGKHHQTYINNLQMSLDKLYSAVAANDVAKIVELQGAIKFNGGGHINHSIFWTNLAPQSEGGGAPPTGDLAAAIDRKWGSFESFKAQFNAKAAAVQGSGWGWLGYNPVTDDIEMTALPNQDPLESVGLVPLLTIDVWEHAYYLQYKNVRPDYLNAIWDVVNFANVQERLDAARSAK